MRYILSIKRAKPLEAERIMNKRITVIVLTLVFTTLLCTAANAAYTPIGYTDRHGGTYALTNDRLLLNDGPGTTRYFNRIGYFGSKDERVHVLARAWDPNNGIWWVKVEYPEGTGRTGWTGYKRFAAYSFDLYSLPNENWY